MRRMVYALALSAGLAFGQGIMVSPRPATSLPPSGAAGGALTGTFPNPTLTAAVTQGAVPIVSSTPGVLDQIIPVSGGLMGATASTVPAYSIAGVAGAMVAWGGVGATPTSPLSLLVTNQNSATETWTLYNSTATTGVTALHLRSGANQGSTDLFRLLTSAGALGMGIYLESDGAGNTVGRSVGLRRLYSFGSASYIAVNNDSAFPAIDLTATSGNYAARVSTSAGMMNAAFGSNLTATSSNQDFFRETSAFAPTSGTATYGAHRVSYTVNQTGGASGITRGLYLDATITAAADHRGFEIANVGATMTAIKAGTGKIIFEDLKTTGAATGKLIVCVDTATGQLYASSSGVACAN